jgi:hypothetical protein
MPRNPNKRRCAYPSCKAWAMRDGELCRAHVVRSLQAGRPRAEIVAPPGERSLPTLEGEIARLAARRDMVDEWLRRQLSDGTCTAAEALRYLSVLNQVAKTIAAMLAQREGASGGVAELERFFEDVARYVWGNEPQDGLQPNVYDGNPDV